MLSKILKKISNTFFVFPREESPLLIYLAKTVPLSIRKRAKPLRNRLILTSKALRVKRFVTKYLGQEYRPTHKSIEIDITYFCDLGCANCNRFCNVAPSQAYISPDQVRKFVKESIGAKRKWQWININGGEPTFHPQLKEIVDILLEYKHNFSKDTAINLFTNGYSQYVKEVLKGIPGEVEIHNSNKVGTVQKHFVKTAQAPIDLIKSKDIDFSNGCPIPICCGIGLTPFGYYPCTVAGAIDRVFGFDAGKKHLPADNDLMTDQLSRFCPYCGFFSAFRTFKIKSAEPISRSWKKALEDYAKSRPKLTPY